MYVYIYIIQCVYIYVWYVFIYSKQPGALLSLLWLDDVIIQVADTQVRQELQDALHKAHPIVGAPGVCFQCIRGQWDLPWLWQTWMCTVLKVQGNVQVVPGQSRGLKFQGRKCLQVNFSLLYATLRYSSLLHSKLPCSALYSSLLYSSLLFSSLLFSTV